MVCNWMAIINMSVQFIDPYQWLSLLLLAHCPFLCNMYNFINYYSILNNNDTFR